MVAMDLFRSEEMSLVQLIIPAESGHDTVSYLGEVGLLQFKDLNPDKSPFQRTYANQVKRCGEMLRKSHYFRDQMAKAGMAPASRPILEKEIDLDELEGKLTELETELLEINANVEKLQRTHSELTELHLVLKKAGAFFSSARNVANVHQRRVEMEDSSVEEAIDQPLLLEQEMQTEPSKQVRLGFITGVVPVAKAAPFERILFRATRGNMFLKQANIEQPVLDPATGEKVEKLVFVVFFAGERARTKIVKICEAFGANRYPFPEDPNRQWQMKAEVEARLAELQTTLDASTHHRDQLLNTIGYNLEQWTVMVRREQAVYHNLNMLSIDVTRKCLVAEAWCPVAAKAKIQDALKRAAYDSNSQVNTIFQVLRTKESPPTFYETNKFTGAFQEIIDAYGVARYQEVNAGCFTIVTFPFLFAVMFGDWGHGIALLLGALYLIINERKFMNKKLGDIMEMAFAGRYVILLMAIFSMYTGLIYNEFFSVPFHIFGSSAYRCRDPACSNATTVGLEKVSYYPYPFGVDPEWHGSRSELPYLNSVKMKMSILLGILQMNLGIILSYFNASFFGNRLDIWYQFVPQLLFLNSLFGYLSVLIVLKWVQGSQSDLYHVMIYMFLSPLDDLGENQLFRGQKYVQVVLLVIALVAVPWMLLPKPFAMRKQHLQKIQGRAYGRLGGSDNESTDLDHEEEHEEEFEFSEVLVHQMIHTIEFVLGCCFQHRLIFTFVGSQCSMRGFSYSHGGESHVHCSGLGLLSPLGFSIVTRLFISGVASLLSSVQSLPDVNPPLEPGYSNPIIKLIGLVVFLIVTTGVLLVMETLSAFLHALRLHWVEFQNKFYQGDGYKFHPFSFKTLEEDEDM